ncbi:MAG: type 1 glutamine amidotransferase, partial [Thermoplasmata archaeon]|nr:type 1 glutamine amidotransferase [Thermoplasmata archaeon]
MKALILAEDGFEDLELFYPYYRLKEEGIDVTIASSKEKIVGKYGYAIETDAKYEEIDASIYDCLVIPGGKSPERVRLNKNAIEITRHFFEKNKPVAIICHGAQVLISAGVVKGRNIACWYGIKDDVIAAGSNFIDGVAVDGNLVSARFPQDLPEWMREFIKL